MYLSKASAHSHMLTCGLSANGSHQFGVGKAPLGGESLPCQRVTLVAIHRILDFSAFQPEQIACMRAAYEDAMDVLKHADFRLSELVAKHIIEVARTGERDPDRLREKALTELGVLSRREQ
jgi:hypothetical protein